TMFSTYRLFRYGRLVFQSVRRFFRLREAATERRRSEGTRPPDPPQVPRVFLQLLCSPQFTPTPNRVTLEDLYNGRVLHTTYKKKRTCTGCRGYAVTAWVRVHMHFAVFIVTCSRHTRCDRY